MLEAPGPKFEVAGLKFEATCVGFDRKFEVAGVKSKAAGTKFEVRNRRHEV